MAAAYTWPDTLPQIPQRGFSETGGINIIRSQTDTGPAKMRRRAASAATLTCDFLMKTTQVSTFEDFVTTSLGGVLRFYFTHPRTKQVVEVRIVPAGSGDLYTISYQAPEYWMVKLTLEVLP
jgi:hypothetical protein